MTKQQQQQNSRGRTRRQTWRDRSIALAVLAGIGFGASAVTPSFAQAQQKRTAAAAAPRSGAAAAPAGGPQGGVQLGKGLLGIPPQEVLSELSARRLETLQKKAFDLYNVPADQRAQMESLNALYLLTDKTKQIPPGDRQRLLVKAVAGIRGVLPTQKDPSRLMEYAGVLVNEGATREVNLMEYWGETPAGQARLRPTAQAVDELFARAIETADDAKAAIEKQMVNPNNEVLAKRWEEVENLQGLATYSRGMAKYMQAMSISPVTAKDERAKVADEGIAILKEHDNEDSTVQPVVKNRIGKLHLVKGEPDVAKQFFTAVANKETKPEGDVNQVYEAKYFSAICDLMRGDVTGAKKQLAALEQWQAENIKDPATLKGVEAAADMLRYRIFSAEAQMSPAGPAKQAAEKNAIDVLMALNAKRPELRQIIFSQLVERIGKDSPVAEMNPLLLEAMVQKAADELDAPLDDKLKTTLARGVEAAGELAKRAKAGQQVPPKLVESSAFLVPHFLEKSDRKADAANAFMDALQKYPQNPEAQNAFRNAGRLTFELRDKKSNPEGWESQPVQQVYERFLPVAVGKPFNMTALAYDYAELLRKGDKKRFKEAADYYALVPSTDPRYLAAQYQRMLSLTNVLDAVGPDKKPAVPAGPARTALVNDIVATAQRVRGLALQAAQSAAEPAKKERELIRVAGCTLTAAQISAAELKDAKQTLSILANFEQEAQGLPANVVDPMLANVLQLRVGSYLESGDFNKATETLLKLLNEAGGEKGQVFVLTVLQKIDEDYRKALAADDKDRSRQLAANRAKLSTFLVDWAKDNKNPDIAKRYYGYSVFDAEAKLASAEMSGDQAEMDAARKAFERLLAPEMTALWVKQNADNKKFDDKFPHPNVLLGLAKAAFAQKDYPAAENAFGRLLNAKKLGTAKIQKVDPRDPSNVQYVDNEPYWEAWYKFLKIKFDVFDANKANPQAIAGYEDAKGALKRQYVVQNPPGGEKWSDEFEELRKTYIPDFDPKTILAAPATADTQPAASQPVAAGAEPAAGAK